MCTSVRWPTGQDDYGLVDDWKREGPSTSILETSAVAYQRKIGETAGGCEESEAGADEVSRAGIRYEMADEQGQEGQTESRGTTTTKGEEADAEVGSTATWTFCTQCTM